MGKGAYTSFPMKYLLTMCLMLLVFGAGAGTDADEHELRELLDEFMAGASVNDAAVHDRFWAEDLVYTSSAGERFGKDRIMAGLADAGPVDQEAAMTYAAREVEVRVFDELAVVTFRLVAEQSGEASLYFFNTGVFRKRDEQWRAVVWQATRAAESGGEE